MCGICGVVQSMDGSLLDMEKSVREMCSRLVHRGPDEEGVYFSNNIALGHRRLSIIDITSGQQPLCNEDRSVWVVFNGEIYNYRTIREDLVKKRHQFKTHSDTEVIVHLYEECGEEMFGLLNGMFAIGLWDEKKKKLILARDRLGKKPLYFCSNKGKFLFASELKAILANPDIPRDIVPESLSNYLSFMYIPPPATIFRDIYKLEPATYIVYQEGNISKKKYWEPTFDQKIGVKRTSAIEQFQDLLQDAVRIRMESEVPLGAFLSGGLDSSTTVAVMAKLTDRPVNTTSIGFEEESFNELSFAAEVSKRYSTAHNEYILKANFIQDLARIIYHLDEPFGDSSALPTYLLCQMTRRKVVVALSGDGGDESFAGYDRYMSALYEEGIKKRVPYSFRKLLFSGFKRFFTPNVRSYTRIENLTLGLPRAASNTFFCFDDEMKKKLFTETFRGKLGNHNSVDVIEEYFKRADGLDPLSRLQYVDLVSYLPEDILMKVDRMSMAHSLEVRSPLLDYRLVEFAGCLPPEWKLQDRKSKVFLKEAVAGMVPDKIVNRSKMGFGVPIGVWFRGTLQRLMEAVLFDKRTIARGYFELAFLQKLWARHLKGPVWQIDMSQMLWVLLVLELWQRIFVDGDTVEDIAYWIENAAYEKTS